MIIKIKSIKILRNYYKLKIISNMTILWLIMCGIITYLIYNQYGSNIICQYCIGLILITYNMNISQLIIHRIILMIGFIIILYYIIT